VAQRKAEWVNKLVVTTIKEAGTVSTVFWPPKIKEFIRIS
jgi:hypothetical protein